MKRRKAFKRRAAFGGFKRFSRRSRSSNSTLSVKPIQVDAMIYGAVREKVSNMLSPLTSKIPLGSIADELGMGLLCYMVAKKTNGMLKGVATKGLIIENARVGEALVDGSLGNILGGLGGSSTTSTPYTYG